jgi:hypothetical protein
MSDSPTIYYRLKESSGTTMVDSSGGGLTGTYTGTFTLGGTGAMPGTTSVNTAGTGYGTSNSSTAINLANHSFTLEGWAKRASNGNWDYLLGQGPATTQDGLQFGYYNDNTFICGFLLR